MDDKKITLKEGSSAVAPVRPEAAESVPRTEEMLKQEARERLEQQAKLEAEKPPVSDRRKKLDNFFYHYRLHTVLAVIGVLMLAFFLRDTIFRPKPDLTVIIASSRFITQIETDALQEALVSVIGDFNGDGKVLVSMDSIYLPLGDITRMLNGGQDADDEPFVSGVNDPEVIQASSMKLMAVISAGTDPLYLLDDELYIYISMMTGAADQWVEGDDIPVPDHAIFETLAGMPNVSGFFDDRVAIKDTFLADVPELEFIKDMTFSVRFPQSKESSIAYQAFCLQMLRDIARP